MLVDTGREQILKIITGQAAVEDYEMLLYTNNYTPVEGTVIGDLTEVVAAGYSRQDLVGWAAPTGPVAGIWRSVATYVEFGNSSGGSVVVYGFAYVGITTGILYGASLFPSPITIPTGETATFLPAWRDTTL